MLILGLLMLAASLGMFLAALVFDAVILFIGFAFLIFPSLAVVFIGIFSL